MMSLSSHCSARLTSEHAARPRGVRPGPVPARPGGAHGGPDLLERRPVVGRALDPEEARRVAPLERDVHLQAAVVRAVRVCPAGLVTMDTKPGGEMRWM